MAEFQRTRGKGGLRKVGKKTGKVSRTLCSSPRLPVNPHHELLCVAPRAQTVPLFTPLAGSTGSYRLFSQKPRSEHAHGSKPLGLAQHREQPRRGTVSLPGER